MKTLREILLSAPDSQLDASMVEKVKLWSEPPTALQLLEVIDLCVFCSLASEIIVAALQYEYENALVREHKAHQDMVKLAVWRPEKDRH